LIDNVVVSQYVNVAEIQMADHLVISPNPVKDVLNINGLDKDETLKYLAIYDLSGKVIHSQFFQNELSVPRKSSWRSGVYLIEVKSEKQVYRQKLILE